MARYVTGLENILKNIQRELMGVKNRTYTGMYKAMKFLESEMDTINPTVPIDTKAMRNSWFIGGSPHPTNPIVFAGYTVPYAPIVHEMTTPPYPFINWTTAGSGAKWLQIHFDRNRTEMLMIVAQNARIPATRSGSASKTSGSFVNISERTNERNVTF